MKKTDKAKKQDREEIDSLFLLSSEQICHLICGTLDRNKEIFNNAPIKFISPIDIMKIGFSIFLRELRESEMINYGNSKELKTHFLSVKDHEIYESLINDSLLYFCIPRSG